MPQGVKNILVRQLYKELMQVQVTHKQKLLANHLPWIDVNNEALRRRIILVPCSMQFKPARSLILTTPHIGCKTPS